MVKYRRSAVYMGKKLYLRGKERGKNIYTFPNFQRSIGTP